MIKVTPPPQDSNSDGDEVESKHKEVIRCLRKLGFTSERAEELWAEEDHSPPNEQIVAGAMARGHWTPDMAAASGNGQEPPPEAKNPASTTEGRDERRCLWRRGRPSQRVQDAAT